MYEKLNDAPDTEEEKKIRYVEKRKLKPTREQTDRNIKHRKVDCKIYGSLNYSKQQVRNVR